MGGYIDVPASSSLCFFLVRLLLNAGAGWWMLTTPRAWRRTPHCQKLLSAAEIIQAEYFIYLQFLLQSQRCGTMIRAVVMVVDVTNEKWVRALSDHS